MRFQFATACLVLLSLAALNACSVPAGNLKETTPADTSELHVYPGEDIQAALDLAADDPALRTVVVHEGSYAPQSYRQALIWFNARHDGLHLRAEGNVTLTATNKAIADAKATSYPAMVNHVIYFGDGISESTRLSGFRITGANNHVTTKLGPPIESDIEAPRLKKTSFFYTNGGGIKIFGRSYPTLEDLTIEDNYSSPCGAGMSIEHRGYIENHVTIRNCIFKNNRTPLTGAAIDLLDHESGSSIVVENCLFVDNLSGCALDARSRKLGSWKPKVGHGAVTVFKFSKAMFSRCTFTGNRNGVDDLSPSSRYQDCIFWKNSAVGGWPDGNRYEIEVAEAGNVQGCFVSGNSYRLDPATNMLEAPDPDFDTQMNPKNSVYARVGFRAKSAVNAESFVAAAGTNLPAAMGAELETLQIDVDGEEFSWRITYPAKVFGTERDITTRRHLYVPVGTKVQLNVGSKDYLYQLALPKQMVREVAVPGMTHACSFTATTLGVYPLVGDQFCGYTHPDLIGKLIVKDPLEFRRWLGKQL